MPDPRDIVDIPGVMVPAHDSRAEGAGPRGNPWLSVWFRCCHVYGRLYRNRDKSAYEGACPGCASRVRVRIGKNGTSRRVFEAR